MILKALYDYYQRDSQSIPFGRKEVLISFVIVISQDGSFVRIEDYRNDNGKGKSVFVPTGEHNNGESPLLFYDNVQYLLDYSENEDASKVEKSHKKHLSFVKRCNEVADKTDDADLKAVYNFYKKGELKKVYDDKIWSTIKHLPLSWITFRIDGHTELVVSKQIIYDYNQKEEENENICLITGRKAPIIRLCASTPIAGTKNSAKLVSFNDDSYCSYSKTQGYNAPISEEAEFAFSTALKKLTRNDDSNHNKFSIGNRTFLFWASSNNETCQQVEESIYSMFGFSDKEDNPNAKIEQVRKVFMSIFSGQLKSTSNDKFYILGLAPNSARIAVVFWSETTVKEFAEKILRHFDDMEIVDTRKDKRPYMGLKDILSCVTLGNKQSDTTPNLPDAIVKSIFMGYPYPQTLFASCIRRIRAEQDLTPYNSPCRMAILKACINRSNNNNEIITPMLDTKSTNKGYLCGRLFAVLDRIQEKANHQHSIQERYMNAASATPAAVFATILNLSNHHAEKLDSKLKVYFEKLKQEIISGLTADGFPTHLDLQDQGRFFVGYYHQRQDFFTSKLDETITE